MLSREDAIAFGNRVIDLGLCDETQTFCEVAIKALEQMPNEDCVSRQAVLDTKVLIELSDGQSFYCISPEDVEELPSVMPTQRWIPVSERLPEEEKIVIASTEYGLLYPEARYTKEGWKWAYESGADYWENLENVLAWMPLPKPYKAEMESEE